MSKRLIGVGLRRWTTYFLKPMLAREGVELRFAANVDAARAYQPGAADTLFFWGASPPAGLLELARSSGAQAIHIEDGFIRSVGLGSDLIRPMSLTLDRRGGYFDATRPSDLEHLLNTGEFSAEECAQARVVRDFIVRHDITKYNLEPRQSVRWPSAVNPVILVPGQVEDDASIQLGCTTLKTNLDLLKAVRENRPQAFIVYKPHPDVLSLNRKGLLRLDEASVYADHVEAGVSVTSCIAACDEVHTMTSQTGFDALLRGKSVVTYGQPFYAGWGLTEDRAENSTAFARRTRSLSLDELVAGVLLRYPVYWDWQVNAYTTCETVLRRIVEQRAALEANGGLERLRVGRLRRQARRLAGLVRTFFG